VNRFDRLQKNLPEGGLQSVGGKRKEHLGAEEQILAIRGGTLPPENRSPGFNAVCSLWCHGQDSQEDEDEREPKCNLVEGDWGLRSQAQLHGRSGGGSTTMLGCPTDLKMGKRHKGQQKR